MRVEMQKEEIKRTKYNFPKPAGHTCKGGRCTSTDGGQKFWQ